MQHMTMDEYFDRVLDEVCWTYYASCLPKNRVGACPPPPPEDAVDFITSPLMAVTLLDRYQVILAERLRAMAIHERDLHDIRSWSPGIWKHLSPDDQSCYHEEAATYEAYLLDHRPRMGCFLTTPAQLREVLARLAPWMWPWISAAHREELLLVAGWCTRTGRLQEETAPPRAITPAMAAALALASDLQHVPA